MHVAFTAGRFTVSANITTQGEVENFLIGDGEEILVEGLEWGELQRLLDHINLERNRLLYTEMRVPSIQGGPLIGGNKSEPPIEGEING